MSFSSSTIGEIRIFAGNFPPRNWAFCNGEILLINDHAALYSVIGNTYGGDGRTTLGLPDLRGRVAIGPGRGPGLSNRTPGENLGQEMVALNTQNLPPHAHSLEVSSAVGNVKSPVGAKPATSNDGENNFTTADGDGEMVTSVTGDSRPHDNMQPSLAINYIICLNGEYPARS